MGSELHFPLCLLFVYVFIKGLIIILFVFLWMKVPEETILSNLFYENYAAFLSTRS